MRMDWTKIYFVLLALTLSLVASIYGQPFIHGNTEAISVIVTVFSVLTGFLIVILETMNDPVLLQSGTWRAIEVSYTTIHNRLTRYKWLSTLYLITLGLVFTALLFQDEFPQITIWLERAFLFFGVFAFILSIFLPSTLMKAQMKRVDKVIEHRRKNDNIK